MKNNHFVLSCVLCLYCHHNYCYATTDILFFNEDNDNDNSNEGDDNCYIITNIEDIKTLTLVLPNVQQMNNNNNNEYYWPEIIMK